MLWFNPSKTKFNIMGNWNIIRVIDEGGFGKVYEVEESTTKQKAALKELKKVDLSNVKRFQREIDTLKGFNHTNIISIFDYNMSGSEKYGPFYIMEYMSGGSLKEMMDKVKRRNEIFKLKWALGNVVLPVIEAIEYAHSQGIYHRDLKPANLLFTDTQPNHIKVADWGIGKDINRNSVALTIGGIGTSGYCSPEQWFANAPVDGRTDIYSLGIILYEMLTGKIPQVYDNSGKIFSIPLPSTVSRAVSAQCNNVILKMLAYSQTNRYQTMTQIKKDLMPIYQSL
jgi:serine/threonine protein kinase